MSKWLDTMHSIGDRMREVQHELIRLGHAHGETGNQFLADKCYRIVKDIVDMREDLTTATSEKISEDFKQAQESSANVLGTALAIADRMAQKPKGEDRE